MNRKTTTEPSKAKEGDGTADPDHWTKATKLQAGALFLTFVTAIATVTVVYLNNQGLIATNRAWLTVDELALVAPLTEGAPLVMRMTLRNSGKSPAYNIDTSTAVQRTNAIPPPEPAYIPGRSRARALVGPGQTRQIDFVEGALAAGEPAQIVAGGLELYFYVLLTYEDPYGHHGLEFCGIYRYDMLPPAGFTDCPGSHNRVW